MTQKEWLEKSEEWRDGYNAFAHNYTIVDLDAKSEEWWRGYSYAANTVGIGWP